MFFTLLYNWDRLNNFGQIFRMLWLNLFGDERWTRWKLGRGGFDVLFFGSYIKKLTNTWLLRVFIGVDDLMPFPTISHLNNEQDRKFPGSQHLLPCHQSLTLVSSTVSPQNNGGVFLVSLYLFVCLYLEIHLTKPPSISIAIYSFHLNHRPATRNEIWCLP